MSVYHRNQIKIVCEIDKTKKKVKKTKTLFVHDKLCETTPLKTL